MLLEGVDNQHILWFNLEDLDHFLISLKGKIGETILTINNTILY